MNLPVLRRLRRCHAAALRRSLLAAMPSKRVHAREVILTVRLEWPYVLNLLVYSSSSSCRCVCCTLPLPLLHTPLDTSQLSIRGSHLPALSSTRSRQRLVVNARRVRGREPLRSASRLLGLFPDPLLLRSWPQACGGSLLWTALPSGPHRQLLPMLVSGAASGYCRLPPGRIRVVNAPISVLPHHRPR